MILDLLDTSINTNWSDCKSLSYWSLNSSKYQNITIQWRSSLSVPFHILIWVQNSLNAQSEICYFWKLFSLSSPLTQQWASMHYGKQYKVYLTYLSLWKASASPSGMLIENRKGFILSVGIVCLVSYSALLTNFTLSLLYPGINQRPALSLHPSSEASEPQSFGLMKFALLLAAISDTPATVQHQTGKQRQ